MILSANKPAKEVADFASGITKVPKGKEIYITDAVMKSFDKKIGDSIYLTVDSKPKEFKIAGTFDSAMYVGFVDNEYIGSKLEFMVFTAKGSVGDLESELSKIFGTNSTIGEIARKICKPYKHACCFCLRVWICRIYKQLLRTLFQQKVGI